MTPSGGKQVVGPFVVVVVPEIVCKRRSLTRKKHVVIVQLLVSFPQLLSFITNASLSLFRSKSFTVAKNINAYKCTSYLDNQIYVALRLWGATLALSVLGYFGSIVRFGHNNNNNNNKSIIMEALFFVPEFLSVGLLFGMMVLGSSWGGFLCWGYLLYICTVRKRHTHTQREKERQKGKVTHMVTNLLLYSYIYICVCVHMSVCRRCMLVFRYFWPSALSTTCRKQWPKW